ncbi:hypothetical protein CBR_g40319 [Chara braunii]|uniref:Uncharacterized protein n=1 Tax=Chara braunii TaxID=69332 RepID=A0A388LTJ5_CHABU|nr:hypothetical protein CBR_g40319 [Chara braunii]|eukprot:GBG85591.1 hypothetical protein CBR_g40319 [Chara braunii]
MISSGKRLFPYEHHPLDSDFLTENGTAMEQPPSQLKVVPAGSGGTTASLREDQPTPMACQECGNRAKRDCNYNRCRTCCKSRGFVCPTHVKSTWVPAAKRREKQRAEAINHTNSPDHLLASLEKVNRSSSSSLPTCSSSTILTSSQGRPSLLALGPAPGVGGNKVSSLPSEITAHTLLKSVKMTGIVDGVLEVGYHASTKIGGQVFKGVLFNAGPDTCCASNSDSHPALTDPSLLALKSAPSAALLESTGLYGHNLALLGSHLKREDNPATAAGVQSMVRSLLSREYWDNSGQCGVWGHHHATNAKYTGDST